MQFGDRLKAMLIERDMSVTRLAERTGVSRNTLYSYLRRNTKKPDPAVVKQIADALDVSPSALLGMPEKKQRFRMQKSQPELGLGAREIPGEEAGESELFALRESLRRSPEMRTLFSMSRSASPEQLRQTIKIIEALRGGEDEF